MDDEIEGRLLAHRMVIAALVRDAGAGARGAVEALVAAGRAAIAEHGEVAQVTRMIPCLHEIDDVLAAADIPAD